MTQDPFAAHGIGHLSASSLNTYAAQPAAWAMSYLLKRRLPVGASAHRGTAIEAGVSAGLFNPEKPVDDCIAIALAEYDRLTALSSDPRREAQRKVVQDTVPVALTELRQYGVPTAPEEGQHQHKISKPLGEGLPDLVGYLDFYWQEHGLVLDLKTTERVPGQISSSHARQGSGYVVHTNQICRFAYCSPKKVAVYQLEGVADHWAHLQAIANRLRRFLAISTDKNELISLLVPDVDSFYWSDPAAEAARKEIYGM